MNKEKEDRKGVAVAICVLIAVALAVGIPLVLHLRKKARLREIERIRIQRYQQILGVNEWEARDALRKAKVRRKVLGMPIDEFDEEEAGR